MDKLQNRATVSRMLASGGKSLLALLASLVVTGLLILACGYNPFEVFSSLFVVSFSSKSNIALVLSQSMPLIFAGLSFVVGIKVGLINVGIEGQMIAGAMCSALVGTYCTFLPGPLLWIATLGAGMVGGGLAFLLCTYLKTRFDASEVITCIMMNNILAKIADYLCNGPLKPQGVSLGQTIGISKAAYMTQLIPKTKLTWSFPIAIVCCVLVYILLQKTTMGYKMRVTGNNKVAGSVGGIRTKRIYFLAAFLSGIFAGMGGAGLVMGIYHRYMDAMTANIGFVGISVAALAAYSPLAVPFSGMVFGMLNAASTTLSRTTNVPLEVMDIIQGLVVVFVSAPQIVTSIKDWRIFNPVKKAVARRKESV